MTDEDIILELAKLVPTYFVSRVAAYRAGMMMAAKIAAAEQKQKQYTDWDDGRKCGIEICITAIERAAGGEG